MKQLTIKTVIGLIFLIFFSMLALSQSTPKIPIMFYPSTKSIFYSTFCKKYQCTFNHKKKDAHGVLEEFGFLDTIYTADLSISTNRSKLGTENWWYTGIDLTFDSKYHYDKSYVDVSQNYLNPDIQKIMSDLLFTAIGKEYTKDQLMKCMNANFKMNRSYYLDEFLKFPASAPITRVSSGQGIPLYLKIYCGFENNIFSIELSP
jgi:hypothetical protein